MVRKIQIGRIQINLSNRWFYTFIAIGILAVIAVGVYAFTGNVGHTSDQIDEVDPTVIASVKDGISWGELSSIPQGFADGVDNIRGTARALYQVPGHCAGGGAITISSTCTTRACYNCVSERYPSSSRTWYYNCNGVCSMGTIDRYGKCIGGGTSPYTCGNTNLGYLVW